MHNCNIFSHFAPYILHPAGGKEGKLEVSCFLIFLPLLLSNLVISPHLDPNRYFKILKRVDYSGLCLWTGLGGPQVS